MSRTPRFSIELGARGKVNVRLGTETHEIKARTAISLSKALRAFAALAIHEVTPAAPDEPEVKAS